MVLHHQGSHGVAKLVETDSFSHLAQLLMVRIHLFQWEDIREENKWSRKTKKNAVTKKINRPKIINVMRNFQSQVAVLFAQCNSN